MPTPTDKIFSLEDVQSVLADFFARELSQAKQQGSGVTQYVGARYVPMFADPIEWSSARTYEPLTIVLHQGNSYTSRQSVPTGVDISDDAFWAMTGNYNAQIEQYRAEVAQFDGRIKAVKGDTERLTGDLNETKSNVTAIDEKIDAITPFDNTPTIDSNKGVTSGGVYNALAAIKGKIDAITPFDGTPTIGSNKGVTSEGVYNALQAISESTSKYVVVIGDSWVMSPIADYSLWVRLFKQRYPNNVFSTRYDYAAPVKILDTKNEIDILASDDTFDNDSITDVLMIAGLNGGTSDDALNVAAYAREKFNANLTFTWAQDCYTPLKLLYGFSVLNVDATAFIEAANTGLNNKYIDLSSFLLSPHFFSNDSNNNTVNGASIIGFHMSKVGSYRMLAYFADYYFGEHIGAWGKQAFNADNFNTCCNWISSTGATYNNTAHATSTSFVDYETGAFKIGFYSAPAFINMDICKLSPVDNSALPTLQLPLKQSAIVKGMGFDGTFFHLPGSMYFGNGLSSGLALMEGSLASSASTKIDTIYLSMD